MIDADLNAEDSDVEVRCHARVSAGRSPSERSLHTCTLITLEGCRLVYLYGGRSKGGHAMDDLHVLDLEANYWSACKPKSEKPAGRFGHCAEGFDNQLFIFGGQSRGQATFKFQMEAPSSLFTGDKKKGMREAESEVTDQLLQYNTETSTWDELDFKGGNACPTPRYKHASCLVPERRGGARMFVFGGQDEEDAALNEEYFLDMKTLTWCEDAPCFCARVLVRLPSPSINLGSLLHYKYQCRTMMRNISTAPMHIHSNSHKH